jgi:hypothetical protein
MELACLAALSLAQTTGSIDGTITDSAGSPLPSAVIEVSSPSLQGTRTATSGRDGGYRIPAAPPGEYRVMASIAGFRLVQKTATVRLGATATADFVLEPAAAEQVVVSGEVPLIDGTSTTTGTNYTSQVIARLPVDRNYADIVRSNPSVDIDRGNTDGRFIPITVYGATSAENQWIIDSVNTTNVRMGTQGKTMSNDFIQEVEVKTGGYPAEYGRALGGIVNVVTKSGGNTFHGDTFLYYDSTETMAQQQLGPEDQQLARVETDDGSRLDYGVDVGGFLLKDRLWFFGAYNRVTLNGHVSRVRSSTYVSEDTLFPFDAATDLYSGKLTWKATPSTTLVGGVFADPSSTSGAAGADPRRGLYFIATNPPVSPVPSTWNSTRLQGGTDYGLQATQLFGTDIFASLQGAYHQDRSSLTATDEIRREDWTCIGGTPEAPCRRPREPNSIAGGYGRIGGGDSGSTSRQQYGAATTFYRGAHEFKAGGDYLDGRVDLMSSWTGQQQVNVFNEFGQTYYQHRFYTASLSSPSPVSGFRQQAQVLDYGAYIQDSWKVDSGLTVNLGLRWDGETTRNYAGQTVFRTNDQWQPRIGIAWDPWRDGSTKVYAFAGRFSYALPASAATLLFFGDSAILTTYNFDPVSVVQDPNVLNHEEAQGGTISFAVPVDAGLKGFSQDELLLGIERMIGPGLTVGLKGTYRRLNNAIDLRADLDYSSPLTDYSSYAVVNPGSSARFASGDIPTCNGLDPPYDQCSPTGPAMPQVARLYRGLEIVARQTVASNLWLQASYIYSSLRGNFDGAVNEVNWEQTPNSPGTTGVFYYPQMWHNGYGALALDRPNRFRLDGYWMTPWRLSIGLQAFVESGTPQNRFGWFNGTYGPVIYLDPRGSSGRLPTLWEGNLQLAYPIVFGPVTATLQAYLFNMFNNQIALSNDSVWSDQPPAGYPETIYDPNQAQTNPDYGMITRRSPPRLFRAAVTLSF